MRDPAPNPVASAAPADVIVRRRWPLWRKVLAYAVLGAAALASIWVVDRRVDGQADGPGADPRTLATPPGGV